MKVLENYYVQQGRYKDSRGKCAILLEDGDDETAIIQEYTGPKQWYEVKYSGPIIVDKYTVRETEYTGRIIVLNTFREYLD